MFYDWLETNQVPKSSIALWHALMHIGNKTGWEEVFAVAVSTIESKTGFKRSELFDARNILAQKGRIIWYQRGGNLCAEYSIIPFCVHNTDTSADTSADANRNTNTYTNPTQTPTINKLNNTKLNNKSFVGDKPPTKKKKKDDFSKSLFWTEFVQVWNLFYEGKNKSKYLYQQKDFGCLKKIYDFLKKRSEEKKWEFTKENLVKAFNIHLDNAYKKDEWLRNNFTIPNILSQFNQIENSKQQENGRSKINTGSAPDPARPGREYTKL